MWVCSSSVFSEVEEPSGSWLLVAAFLEKGEAPRKTPLWLSGYLVMVSVTLLIQPIQHLWALLWRLPIYLDSEIRAGRIWDQRVKENFGKYRVARFQKSPLPLKCCLCLNHKGHIKPLLFESLVIKLRKPTCPTPCDGVHLQIVIPSQKPSPKVRCWLWNYLWSWSMVWTHDLIYHCMYFDFFRPQACGPELISWLFFTLRLEEKVSQKSRYTGFIKFHSFLSF